MIKCICFDIGAVLVKPDSEVAPRILSEHFSLNRAEIEKEMKRTASLYDTGSNSEEFYKNIAKRFNIPSKNVLDALCTIKLLPPYYIGGELKDKGYALYVLSNQKEFKGEFLKRINFFNLFDGLFLSYEMNLTKPSDEFFEYFLKETGLEAVDCLFIDDSQENVNAAKRMGFEVILYNNISLRDKLTEKGIL